MKLILVMLNNFQNYILDNIDNLKRFGNNDITVITDRKFKDKFSNKQVKIIPVEDIIPNYTDYINSLKHTFRNGFWELTSFRFNVLYHYMNKYNITKIVHIENDILIYTDLDKIIFHQPNKLLLTMDAYNRCIPGIMYIPNANVLGICLKLFKKNLNDMQNFAICFHNSNVVDTLPIFIDNTYVTNKFKPIGCNFDKYNCIFDAAAIGQYLGGIDPRIHGKMMVGFVNETCIVDYSKYNFVWENINGLSRPFIIIDNIKIPIINLHIHSKNIRKFMDDI